MQYVVLVSFENERRTKCCGSKDNVQVNPQHGLSCNLEIEVKCQFCDTKIILTWNKRVSDKVYVTKQLRR